MTEATSRFLLPFILPGQAQKELFHNEALVGIDTLLHAAIEDGPINTPPATPEPGQSWLVGAAPTGFWAGQADKIVTWTEGGWRFFAATEGVSLWNKATGFPVRWTGEEWTSQWTLASVAIDHQVILQVFAKREMRGKEPLVQSRKRSRFMSPHPLGGAEGARGIRQARRPVQRQTRGPRLLLGSSRKSCFCSSDITSPFSPAPARR